jgi:hypothetical protein
MVKKLTLIAFVLLTLSVSAQQKRDTAKYAIVLGTQDIDQLFYIIRTSGKYTGVELENFIQSIRNRLVLLPPPKIDTIAKKSGK